MDAFFEGFLFTVGIGLGLLVVIFLFATTKTLLEWLLDRMK